MTATIFQLTMRSGPMPGKTFTVEKEETNVGRDLANDIPIGDPEVSRRHARFLLRDDSVFVEDLGSTNGTFLNGERIASPQQLRKGDVITLGESVVMVFDKVTYDPDATVVAPSVEGVSEPVFQPPAPQPVYEPETYQPPVVPAPYEQPEPMTHVVVEEYQEPVKPQRKIKAKRDGMPTWMIVLIIAIVMLVCVIAVTVYFMPASWWCALTFDALPGCPLP